LMEFKYSKLLIDEVDDTEIDDDNINDEKIPDLSLDEEEKELSKLNVVELRTQASERGISIRNKSKKKIIEEIVADKEMEFLASIEDELLKDDKIENSSIEIANEKTKEEELFETDEIEDSLNLGDDISEMNENISINKNTTKKVEISPEIQDNFLATSIINVWTISTTNQPKQCKQYSFNVFKSITKEEVLSDIIKISGKKKIFFTDNIMNCYFGILQYAFPNFLFLSSFTLISNASKQFNALSTFKQKIFIPININDNHWCLLIIYNNEYFVYDSYKSAGKSNFELIVKQIEELTNTKPIVLTYKKTKHQVDNWSCGFWVCLYATLLAHS
jgi:hypothetical protein